MPLVSDQLENIAKLPPFDILLDHLDERVENANIEMCPDVDLSEEATFEFYEEEDFKFGKQRMDWERRNVNYTI